MLFIYCILFGTQFSGLFDSLQSNNNFGIMFFATTCILNMVLAFKEGLKDDR